MLKKFQRDDWIECRSISHGIINLEIDAKISIGSNVQTVVYFRYLGRKRMRRADSGLASIE